tara:strand:- start:5565 stop:6173 length:609 start_codon:yes stop_codon:yes gene_type:complete
MALKTKSEFDLQRKSFDRDKIKKDIVSPIESAQPTQRTSVSNYGAIQEQSIVEEARYNKTEIQVIQNAPYITSTGSFYYTKVFDSVVDLRLQDIVFVNTIDSETLSFDVILSEYDIDLAINDTTIKYPNQTLLQHSSTVYLLQNYDLRANTSFVSDQTTSNMTTLREAGMLNDALLSSKQKQIFIYVGRTTSTGDLDITVLK